MGWDGNEPRGEKLAHYFEFVFGIISASITFSFTMDSKLAADTKIKILLQTVGEDVELGGATVSRGEDSRSARLGASLLANQPHALVPNPPVAVCLGGVGGVRCVV